MRNMPTRCVYDLSVMQVCFGLIGAKVIQKIGLCIGFYDLLESSDGLIGHGTGLVNVNGEYRAAQEISVI